MSKKKPKVKVKNHLWKGPVLSESQDIRKRAEFSKRGVDTLEYNPDTYKDVIILYDIYEWTCKVCGSRVHHLTRSSNTYKREPDRIPKDKDGRIPYIVTPDGGPDDDCRMIVVRSVVGM